MFTIDYFWNQKLSIKLLLIEENNFEILVGQDERSFTYGSKEHASDWPSEDLAIFSELTGNLKNPTPSFRPGFSYYRTSRFLEEHTHDYFNSVASQTQQAVWIEDQGQDWSI